MSDINTLYKVITLYLLDKSEVPLANSDICEFFVRGEYTDYFTALSIINDLSQASLIESKSGKNVTTHSINPKGETTLHSLLDRIGSEIKNEVFEYLAEKKISFKQARETFSDYYRSEYGGYTVHLKTTEDKVPVLNMEIQVGNEALAKSICTNWKSKSTEIYDTLLDNLL